MLIWENGNTIEVTKFLKIPATLTDNEDSSEEECIGVMPDKNESRLVKITCSTKSSGAICKKKGIISEEPVLILKRIVKCHISAFSGMELGFHVKMS